MLNTTNDISARTNGYATKSLLKRGAILNILGRFGQVDPQGYKNTTVRRYRRYESLAPAIAPLAEGVTPPGKKLSWTDVIINLEQYGDFVKITDVVADTHEDPILNEAVKLIGEQCAETVEIIRFYVLRAGSTVYRAGSVATRLLVNGTITKGMLGTIDRGFHRAKARMINEQITASALIATEPCEQGWIALCSTDLNWDVRNIEGFKTTVEYSRQTGIVDGELGSAQNFRFICNRLYEPWLSAATSVSSTTWLANGIAPAAAANPDVYPILFVAADAYALVPLQADKRDKMGKNAPVNLTVRNPVATTGDELGQRGFVSWKMMQGTGILNQSWLARGEVCATANP